MPRRPAWPHPLRRTPALPRLARAARHVRREPGCETPPFPSAGGARPRSLRASIASRGHGSGVARRAEAGVTQRMRLSLAFLFIVIVPLVVAAVVVGQGVPNALDTSGGNRLEASPAAAREFGRSTCVQVRLAAEVLAREVAEAAKTDR